MAKKYMSVFNDGTQDLTIKDAEVREAVGYDMSQLVDLGLPSGTLWAKMNVGAESETGYGKYYKYGKGAEEYSSSQSDYTGTEDPLAAAADTATVTLGLPWHMPTRAQFQELIANTTLTWEENFNGSGINGMKFTAQNGNYIFFPGGGERGGSNTYYLGEAGRYWSSTPYNNNRAYALRFGDDGNKYVDDNLRYSGYSIRPVCDSAPLVKMSSKADKDDVYTKTEANTRYSAKADKVSGATNNNFAALNSNGNLKDSGYSIDGIIEATLNFIGISIDEEGQICQTYDEPEVEAAESEEENAE